MTAEVKDQASPKSLLREVIEAQPEDASHEEMAFERMVERGLLDARTGRSVDHEEALRRIG